VLAGPCLAFGSCFASFSGAGFDYEHHDNNTLATTQAADRASVQTGLIVMAAVLFLAVDAWRLATLDERGTTEPESDPEGA
jgi:hypothetical protein